MTKKVIPKLCPKCGGLMRRRLGGWPRFARVAGEDACTDCYQAAHEVGGLIDDEDGQALKERVA